MADIIINLFDESKRRVRTIYQLGRDAVADEINESFDIERVLRRRTLSSIFGSGYIGVGWQVITSANPNEINIQIGDGLVQGEHLNNPSTFPVQSLTTPSGADRTDIVYMRVREVEIDSVTDPSILFPDVGETARRIILEIDIFVDEGSGTLPTTTGDLHDAGVHYELLGFLNRVDGVDTVSSAQIIDSRRIIGFTFLNEDKSLELIGGGEVNYLEATGTVSWDTTAIGGGLGGATDTGNIWIIQPSTPGNAYIDRSNVTSNPFFLPNNGDIAYVNLDRNAVADYEVDILITSWSLLPNNSNTYIVAFRGVDGKLYFNDGTCWGNNQTHLIRINPFTGQIFDPDVAVGADIQGSKLLIGSVPLDRLVSIPQGVPKGGIILWDESAGIGCPADYTKLELGNNDTYVRIAGVGGSANTTPSGSNSHNHGSHSHGDGSYKVTLPLLDLFNIGFGANIFFDAFQAGIGGGFRNQNFSVTGTSSGTTISTVGHEPKRVQLLLCRRN